MDHHHRIRRRLLGLTVAAVTAAACSSGGDDDKADVELIGSDSSETEATATTEATVDSATPSSTAPSDTTVAPATTDESPATIATPSTAAPDPDEGRPSEPLASRKGAPPFVELRIIDFRRVGKTVTLEFEIETGKGDSAGDISVRDMFSAPEDTDVENRPFSVSGVTLVDEANRKRHLVLRDTTGACVCTGFGPSTWIDERTTFPHSASFPAPPPDVQRMTIDVPRFPAIDNVPLREVGG